MNERKCDLCGEGKPVATVSLWDNDGNALDAKAVCWQCLTPFLHAGLELPKAADQPAVVVK